MNWSRHRIVYAYRLRLCEMAGGHLRLRPTYIQALRLPGVAVARNWNCSWRNASENPTFLDAWESASGVPHPWRIGLVRVQAVTGLAEDRIGATSGEQGGCNDNTTSLR